MTRRVSFVLISTVMIFFAFLIGALQYLSIREGWR